MKLFYNEMVSPIGSLLMISDVDSCVLRIDYGTLKDLSAILHEWSERYFNDYEFIQDTVKMNNVEKELIEYFNGRRKKFTFNFKLYGTDYQKQVWNALLDNIPYGETQTYKYIAVAIDNPKSVRAVGGAVNKNPFSIVIPCHRVIGTNGQMVGYNGGIEKKEFLLKLEQNNIENI